MMTQMRREYGKKFRMWMEDTKYFEMDWSDNKMKYAMEYLNDPRNKEAARFVWLSNLCGSIATS